MSALALGLCGVSACAQDDGDGASAVDDGTASGAGTESPPPTAPTAMEGAPGPLAADASVPATETMGEGPMRDGGRLPDVEVWMPPDAGMRENPDPTQPEGGTRICSPLLLAIGRETEPACTAETGRCVIACAGLPDPEQEACRNACSAADTYVGGSSDCGGCLGLRPLACFDENGCSINPLYCCLEDNCQLGDDGCTEAKCNLELQTLFGCVGQTPAALTCLDYENGPVSSCFAPPADAGT